MIHEWNTNDIYISFYKLIDMRIKLQKVRPGTKYESYRLSIPKAIVKLYKLDEYDFDMEFIDGKIVLSLIGKEDQQSQTHNA